MLALFVLFATTVTLLAAPAYPLKASANQRYLVDQNNLPVLLVGDSPHTLFVNLTVADATIYLQNRGTNGFNALWCQILATPDVSGRTDLSTYDGIIPFTTPNDISTPNPAYFARVDQMIAIAAANGLTVVLDTFETHYLRSFLTAQGATKMFNYGVFLGNRYKNTPNILWMTGNDYQYWNTDATANNLIKELMRGIASVDSNHLQTLQLNFPYSGSLDNTLTAPYVTLNGVYNYYVTYDKVYLQYNQPNYVPVYLQEAAYEDESNFELGTPNLLRRQAYWTVLAGGLGGQMYGHLKIGGHIGAFLTGWENSLNSTGVRQLGYWKTFITSKAWYDLVPDQDHTVVTAGYGTYKAAASQTFGSANDYVTTARTPDGTLVLAYTPVAHTLTVDMTKLAGSVTARWFDPAAGTYTGISGSPFSNTGTRNFTTPGNNSAGSGNGDWVLVLEAQSGIPTISDIFDQATTVGTATAATPFTVNDADTPAGNLTLSQGSSNTNLVPLSNIVFGGSGSNRTVMVAPVAGQTGTATITVTVSDGVLSASDTFVLTVNAVNTAPTITGVGDQTINEDTSTGALNFTVGDAESAAGSLTLGKGSSNPTLVPTNNIVLGGPGANRTVTVNPAANQAGSATITVSVSDGQYTVNTNFLVTVNAVNDAPTISGIANQTINVNTSTGPLSFTIGDAETAAGSLTLDKVSSNWTLVPLGNIVLGGSGANRTVTVTPAAGQSGTATITVSVSDGVLSASNSFVVTVSTLFVGSRSFTNAAAITIPSQGAATPYPSIINVAGMGGAVSNMAVTLRSLSHTWGNDIDALLVGPGGQAVRVMENAGTGPTANANLTFSNNAAATLPKTGALPSGAYKPTTYPLDPNRTAPYPSPAPAGPYGTNFMVFDGQSPNGAWSLYVFDNGPGDAGSLAGGWSLAITTTASVQQTPIISWGNPGGIVYGTGLGGAQLNASASVPGTFVYSPAAGTVLHAGNGQSLSVTFTPTDSQNYTAVTNTVLLDVQKASLTITADSKNKVYGAALPGLTASYSGFVNGDTVGSLTTPVSLGTGANAGSAVGGYAITASGATSGNYAITHVNGTLTVSAASLTITADNKSKLLGQPNPPLTASYAGFVNGDTVGSLDVGVNLATPATESSPAGGYPIVASGAADVNYAITHLNGTLMVEAQGAPVVTLSGGSLSYTENAGPVLLDPAATVTDADSADLDTGSLTVAFTLNGAGEDRLTIRNQGSGSGEISVASDQVSYGGTLIGNYTGGNNGTTPLVVDLNADATPAAVQALLRNVSYENVSSTPSTLARTVRVVVMDGDGGSSVPVTRTILVTGVPEAPVISWGNAGEIVYGTGLGGAQLNATASVPGTFVYSPAAGTVLHAGNGQSLGVTFTPTDGQNYTAVTNTVLLDVQKAALTITADSKNKVYGAALPGLTASYAGFVNGDTVGSLTTPVSLGTGANAGSAVGGYAITASGATSGNYAITHVNGTLTVSAASLTITADNKSRLLGQPNPPLTASYAGFVNGDTVGSLDVGVNLTTPATESSPAGAYPIMASGTVDVNYTITHVNGALTVTNPPAPGTVGTLSFTNATAITIPSVGAATPYPATNNVAGLSGTISNVTLTLKGITHARLRDVDILLVGPGGQKIIVLSDVGPNSAVNNVTLTLSDAAAASLGTGTPVSGTYKPTDLTTGDTFVAPAPAGPYGTNFGVFKGASPNGTWSLYVVDDSSGSTGTIAGGWSLTVTTMGPQPPFVSTIANQSTVVNTATAAIPFTIGDVDTAVGSLTLSGGSSNPALVPPNNIVFGGSGSNRTVTVTPAAGQTGTATITVSASDGALSTSNSFILTVSTVVANTTAVSIPSVGVATPYPSTVNVSGLTGTVSNVTLTLNGITHARMRDIDILLTGPGGRKAIALSDVGPNGTVNNVTLTLSDAAAAALGTGTIVSGTYKPTNIGTGDTFASPAPTGPYGTNLAAFNGQSPNGAWSLYLVDDNSGSTGRIVGGWSLNITTVGGGAAAPTISDIGDQVTTVNTATAAVPFTVNDADTPVGNLTLSRSSSNPTLVPSNDIVFGGSGANRTVTVSPAAGQTGTATVTVTVSDGGLSASDTFVLTVNAVNTPPTITGVGDQTINEDTSTAALTFTVGDAESAAGSLTVSPGSSNAALVPTNNIVLGGSGANRTVTVSPAANQSGSATITLRVSDGQYVVSTNFVVTVIAVNDAPTISGIANQTINVDGTTGPLDFTIGDVEAAAGSLTLDKDSSNPALVPLGNIVLGGSGANRTVTVSPTAGQSGTATITLGVSDGDLSASNSFVLAVSSTAPTGVATGPLVRLAGNPRYFTDGSGKAIYLTGSHTWGNNRDYGLTDPPPPFDFTAYLNFLQSHHHNFFRLWTWELPHSEQGALHIMWWRLPFPWPRTGPGVANDGKPKFDLAQFSQPYFDRLRARVVEAGNRGLYVAIMLWDGFGLQTNPHPTDGFPLTAGNNINGLSSDGISSQSLVNAGVTAVQEAYAQKVIDTVNDLDNVLYEIVNEAGGYSTAWQYHMINFIKQLEAVKPKQHPVGMTYQYAGGSNTTLYNSPADWISTSEQYPVSDGTKVIINDTDHSYYYTGLIRDGPAVQQAWVWKNFLSGNNTLFMDPYLVVWEGRNAPTGTTPDPYWEVLRNSLGYTRLYAEKMNLAAMTPRPTLASSGRCLANPGSEYLVYAGSGNFTLTTVAGTYRYEWFDPTTGAIAASGTLTLATGNQSFSAPFSGDSVLYLRNNSLP